MPEAYADLLKKWAKRRERIKKLRAGGKSLREIAVIIGVSKGRVHQIVRST